MGMAAWANKAGEPGGDGTRRGWSGMNQENKACSWTHHSHGFVMTTRRPEYLPAAQQSLLGPEAKVQKLSEKTSLAGRASSETALEGVKCSGKGG